jgi:hypothetical protein
MWTLIIIVIIGFVGYKFYKNKQEEWADKAEESREPQPTPNANAADEKELLSEEDTAGSKDQGRLRKTRLNKKWRTINSWSHLIAGAQGKEGTVANSIKKALNEVAAPNIGVEHRKISLSGISGMFTDSRKQLVVENRRLRGYHIFISIEDYGKQLNVSWYLMIKKNWLTSLLQLSALHDILGWFLIPVVFIAKIFYSASSTTIPELMNMFDIEELTAYGTTVHNAVISAVEQLMGSLNMDFSKVDTKSKGFLNIG